MPLKPCLVCGRLSAGPRCPAHQIPRTAPNRIRRPGYDWAEVQRRKAAVDAHRAEYGDWCPGWAHQPPHPVTPPNILTADHLHPPGQGGPEGGPLTARCRSCNSSRGALDRMAAAERGRPLRDDPNPAPRSRHRTPRQTPTG